MGQDERLPAPNVEGLDLTLSLEIRAPVRLERAMQVGVRQARLLTELPWVRALGRLGMNVSTEGWRFPTPPAENDSFSGGSQNRAVLRTAAKRSPSLRIQPPKDTVVLKERLLYL